MKGCFITLEGGEGTGKTTAASKVIDELESRGIHCVYTREPGGIDIAEQIREVILNTKNTAMDPRCEALLYAAARRQHLVQKVVPALNEGKVVICDRFVDSSLVYQGVARKIGIQEVYDMNLFAIGDVMPDLTIFFDLEPEVGLARIAANQEREVNRLDKEDIEFHHMVHEGYKEIAKMFPERIHTIDASKSRDEVYQEVLDLVLNYYGK